MRSRLRQGKEERQAAGVRAGEVSWEWGTVVEGRGGRLRRQVERGAADSSDERREQCGLEE